MSLIDDLHIVILDCPYDTMDQSVTQSLFPKIIDLKISGYLAQYNYGVLPIDTTDFIGTNLAVCRREGEKLIPLMAFKSIKHSQCEKFGLPFASLSLTQSSENSDCHNKTLAILKSCKDLKIDISYDSSWTMLPKVRSNKPLAIILSELMAALLVHYHMDKSFGVPQWIACGILRFKTDLFFEKLGTSKISEKPNFDHRYLQGEKAIMVHLEKYSEYAHRLADRYSKMWENKLVINKDSPKNIILSEVAA